MKLTQRLYFFLILTGILIYTFRVIYLFITLNEINLIYGVLFSIPIFYFSYIKFLQNWFRYKSPFLLDYLKLTSFILIVIPFLIYATQIDQENYIKVFRNSYVNRKYIYDFSLVLLSGFAGIGIVQFFSQRKFKISSYELNFKLISYFDIISILTVLFIFIFYFIDLVGFGSSNQNSTLGFIIQLLNTINYINIIILLYLKFFKKNFTSKQNFTFYFVMIFSFIISFISGMKELTLILIIFIFSIYLMSGKKIKFSYLIPFFIVIFVLQPINKSYREILNNVTDNKIIALQISISGYINSKSNIGNDEFTLFDRADSFYPLIWGISIEEKWDKFKYFDRYIYAPVAWIIPRPLLPSKPINTYGGDLYRILRNNNTENVSITPTTFGWSYFEGGLVFVFLSFFLLSLLIVRFENYFRKKNTISNFVIYIIILSSLFKVESDIYFRVVAIFQTIFVVKLYCRFIVNNYEG